MDARTTLALRIERHGPPEVLVEREIPFAPPGPGEVHLRVRAAGVNFADRRDYWRATRLGRDVLLAELRRLEALVPAGRTRTRVATERGVG